MNPDNVPTPIHRMNTIPQVRQKAKKLIDRQKAKSIKEGYELSILICLYFFLINLHRKPLPKENAREDYDQFDKLAFIQSATPIDHDIALTGSLQQSHDMIMLSVVEESNQSVSLFFCFYVVNTLLSFRLYNHI